MAAFNYLSSICPTVSNFQGFLLRTLRAGILSTLTSFMAFTGVAYAGESVSCTSSDQKLVIQISFSSTEASGMRAKEMAIFRREMSGVVSLAHFSAATGYLNNSESFVVGYVRHGSNDNQALTESLRIADIDSVMVDFGNGNGVAQVIFNLVESRQNGERALTREFHCQKL